MAYYNGKKVLSVVKTENMYTGEIDQELDESSTNPVENRVITNKLQPFKNIAYEDITPEVQTGWVQSNGNIYSNGVHIEITIDTTKKYLITGTCVNSSFPLIVYENANGNVVGTQYSEGSQVTYFNVSPIIPNGATKMLINGYDDWGAFADWTTDNPSVKRILPRCVEVITTYYNENLKEELNNKATKQIKYVPYTNYLENIHRLLSSTGANIKQNTIAGYGYVKIAFDRSKKYRLNGIDYNITSGTTAFIFGTDKNDKIVFELKGKDENVQGLSSGHLFSRYELDNSLIPFETAYLYISYPYGNELVNPIEVQEEKLDVSLNDTNKKIICLGDSITQGNNASEWGYYQIKSSKTYPSLMGEILGAKVYNGGLGGGTAYGNRTIDLANVVSCLISGDFSSIYEGISQYNLNKNAVANYQEIEELDLNDVDIITLSFGTNDWNFGYTKEQIKTALETNINALLTAYPHLKIYIFTPIIRFKPSTFEYGENWENDTTHLTLLDIVDAEIEVANKLNVPVKDCFRTLGINGSNRTQYFNNTDGTHPQPKGYILMAEKYAKFINSN